jgi:hypothetical protein
VICWLVVMLVQYTSHSTSFLDATDERPHPTGPGERQRDTAIAEE